MKKITLALLSLALVAILASCGFTEEELNNAVNDAKAPLDGQITTLTDEKNDLLAEIEELEAAADALNTEKATLDAKVAELEAKIEKLLLCAAGDHTNSYTINKDGTHTLGCEWCERDVTTRHSFDETGACICGFTVTPLQTPDQLREALKAGGGYMLTQSISVPNDASAGFSSDVVLHLNGYDVVVTKVEGGGLQVPVLTVREGGSLTIYGDGSVTHESIVGSSLYCEKGEMTVSGGTYYNGVLLEEATATINDGTFHDGIYVMESTVTINGGTFLANIDAENSTLIINGGTFRDLYLSRSMSVTINGGTFSMDPVEYVDTTTHTVTYNGDGTWTVTAQ